MQIIEKVVEDISFNAPERTGSRYVIDKQVWFFFASQVLLWISYIIVHVMMVLTFNISLVGEMKTMRIGMQPEILMIKTACV